MFLLVSRSAVHFIRMVPLSEGRRRIHTEVDSTRGVCLLLACESAVGFLLLEGKNMSERTGLENIKLYTTSMIKIHLCSIDYLVMVIGHEYRYVSRL